MVGFTSMRPMQFLLVLALLLVTLSVMVSKTSPDCNAYVEDARFIGARRDDDFARVLKIASVSQALHDGTIRPADAYDIHAWKARARQKGEEDTFSGSTMSSFVIQGAYTLPPGAEQKAAGLERISYILAEDVPYPKGDASLSFVHDMKSGRVIEHTSE